MRLHPLAHTGQIESQAIDLQAQRKIAFAKVGERHPLTIIRAALRAAALSNSDRDALDILGDAMLSLAGVTPLGEYAAFTATQEKLAEVRHGL